MDCPKDGSRMEERRLKDERIDVCNMCGGAWLDWGELRRSSGGLVTEHELIEMGKSRRNCPKCGAQMKKASLHSVIVEQCSCGLFFDKGEYEKVVGVSIESDPERIVLNSKQLEELRAKGKIILGDKEITLKD